VIDARLSLAHIDEGMLIVELPISKSVVRLRLRQRSLVIEHRVGVSHVKPAFQRSEIEPWPLDRRVRISDLART
jgi:hypothetical protein